MEENRGYHLEIWALGKKEIHHHDTKLERFTEKASSLVADFLDCEGVDRDENGKFAQNINIKWYTV